MIAASICSEEMPPKAQSPRPIVAHVEGHAHACSLQRRRLLRYARQVGFEHAVQAQILRLARERARRRVVIPSTQEVPDAPNP